MSLFLNGVISTSFQESVRRKRNTELSLLFSLPHPHPRSFLGPPELQVCDLGCSGEPRHQDGLCGWAAVVWLPEPSAGPQPGHAAAGGSRWGGWWRGRP